MASPSADAAPPSNYYGSYLPPSVRTRLEAGAFRSLCSHLRDRSDSVQNIDLMTVGGFCRNCLAKWLVAEARRLSSQIRDGGGSADDVVGGASEDEAEWIARALDALGYDEAAEEVYGCEYGEWKAAHAKKATEGQMERYASSKTIHAVWDKKALAKRGDRPDGGDDGSLRSAVTAESWKVLPSHVAGGPVRPGQLLSDVCCQDVDGGPSSPGRKPVGANPPPASGYVPPPPPAGATSLRLGILTVSDRAASDEYETGDLSGPAVERAVESTLGVINAAGAERGGGTVEFGVAARAVVPDEADDIARVLREWSDGGRCDLVLTTGGTGFAPRDVTPEATLSVLDRESRGLMSWASAECATRYGQPMASLSRAAAGMRGKTVVANLPGNPAGAAQVVEVVLPLLVHAVRDLGKMQ